MSRTQHARSGEARHDLGRLLPLRTPRHDGRAVVGHDDVQTRSNELVPAALRHRSSPLEAPFRPQPYRGEQPAHERRRDPAGIEAPCSGPGLERSVFVVALLREVARPRDPQAVRFGDDERPGRFWAAEPLLPRDREEVDAVRVDWNRADGLGGVDEDGHARAFPEGVDRQDLPGRPEDV